METERGVSCVIPFYNEEQYLPGVLDVISKIGAIKEVICVDDGSNDGSAELITMYYPGVKLVRTGKNRGKAEAVRLALPQVKHSHVLLIDADLKNLDPRDITHAIEGIVNNKAIGMVILSRKNAPRHLRFFRINTLLSGERILSTDDLKNILDNKVNGYQLETAINMYMLEKGKRTVHFPSKAENTFKFEKHSSVLSVIKDLKMYSDVISHAGLFNFISLCIFFSREKLRTPRHKPFVPSFNSLFRVSRGRA
jgi:glycosyltransferase involved in cell wall biosynthesis